MFFFSMHQASQLFVVLHEKFQLFVILLHVEILTRLHVCTAKIFSSAISLGESTLPAPLHLQSKVIKANTANSVWEG